ncbi:hypothetical protein [Streptomyces sp. S1D4-20]|uniref:hypothetical protein n=1 Tax=Streptomyces sp. S1D4-20 TaxID=2594462 RepID=UPI001162EA2A|nr:hypothetical protein [Streptomyces sp. S1D4-20]QDN54268.1 hypothetical protein FNV67_01505 [Streptomyces sp. S1D4-20]
MAQEAEADDAATQRQDRARRHIQVVTETQMRLRQLEAAQRAAHAAPLPPKPARPQHYYAELQSPTMAARPR